MNAPRDVLLFDLEGATYGLDATLVRETLWLPELAPAEEAPPWVVGQFNLRGSIVPVVDLVARLGRGGHRCRTTDQVLVLAANGASFAVIVEAVRDLAHLPPEALMPPPGFDPDHPAILSSGSTQVGDVLATLLDGRALFHPLRADEWRQPREQAWHQGETPDEKAIFRCRAAALCRPAAPEVRGRQALAVVEIDGQCFGIELGPVRQFCRVGPLCRIPCCPPHVAGVFSLRGHLVTLLELAAALSLPPPATPRAKAVIAAIGEQAVALAVDEVLDVINPGDADLEAPPPELTRRHGAEIRAVARFDGRKVAVLDLPRLLDREEWVVDETVG